MHVGILTACYAPVVNGVTRMVTLYEKHLTAAGHQVTTFTLGQPAPDEDTRRVIRSPGFSLGETGYHVALGYNPVAQRKLQRVDILHSHHLLMGLEFARRYGKGPVVFTNHTRYDLYLTSYGHVPHWVADHMMGYAWSRLTKLADVVIAPSTSIANLLRKSGVSTPIEVIENGVEVERFQRHSDRGLRAELQISEDAYVFVYVGRMAPEKNLWKLMAEFGLAADQNDNVYLLGVGGGSMLNEISEMAAELGLTHRTRFVGPVDPELVPAYLAIGDAFVSASVSEVLPLTVIEALATGLPVLAIESPGMHDIVVSDVSGLLVSGSKGSLAQAMVAVASNSGLHSRLGAGAKMAGQRFDIQNTIEQTLSLYRRLIERRDYVDRGTATACSARRADKSQQPEINERFSSSWQERSTSDHG